MHATNTVNEDFGYTVYLGFLNRVYGILQLKLWVFGISLSLNFRYTVYNASIYFGYIWMNFGYFGEFFSGILVTHLPPPPPPPHPGRPCGISKVTIPIFKMLYFRNERRHGTRNSKKDLFLGHLQPPKDKIQNTPQF